MNDRKNAELKAQQDRETARNHAIQSRKQSLQVVFDTMFNAVKAGMVIVNTQHATIVILYNGYAVNAEVLYDTLYKKWKIILTHQQLPDTAFAGTDWEQDKRNLSRIMECMKGQSHD